MKASTEVPGWPPSASSLGRSVTLSRHTAALRPLNAERIFFKNEQCTSYSFQVCVFGYVSYLRSTQTDVKEVIILRAFGSEARSVHNGPRGGKSAEVKLKTPILLDVCEHTVAKTHAVLLSNDTCYKLNRCYTAVLYIRSIPCCFCCPAHMVGKRLCHWCDAQTGRCSEGTLDSGWSVYRCNAQRGTAHRRSRDDATSGHTPCTTTPPRLWH